MGEDTNYFNSASSLYNLFPPMMPSAKPYSPFHYKNISNLVGQFAPIKNLIDPSLAASAGGYLGNMLGNKLGGDGLFGVAAGNVVGQVGAKAAESIASGSGISGVKDLTTTNGFKGASANLAGAIAGNIIGESIGGTGGRVVGQTIGNLGSNIGSALAAGKSVGAGLKSFTSLSNLSNLGMSTGTIVFDSLTKHNRYNGDKADIAMGADVLGGLGSAFAGSTGSLAGLGMSAVNAITGGTDGMTTQDALLGSSGLAGALTLVPGAGPFLSAGYIALSGLNSALGGTSHTMKNTGWQDQELLGDMWEGYAGSHKKDLYALSVAGKKYGLTSNGARRDANDKVDAANLVRKKLLGISNQNEVALIRGNNMTDMNALAYYQSSAGGYELRYNKIGKNGMKLPTKQDIDKVKTILSRKSGGTLLSPKPELYSILAEPLEEEVEFFKLGGTIIPEGALHARKNNMEGAGKDFTHKGIPVIDNQGELLAEIERDEIIFSKEVTSKLEELMKDGSDKAAIEAGKLLVKEIFENTEDRTGLIASIIGEEPLEEDLTKFEEGGTVEIAKDGAKTPRKRKYDTPWKFINYLNSTGRGLNDDYDYESFYNNEDAYFKWEDEEENNPGKAHMSGDFKKFNHITYSDEGFGWKGSDEEGWTFTVSPRLLSLRSYDTYVNYWNENEPESTLVYGDKTYKVKKND